MIRIREYNILEDNELIHIKKVYFLGISIYMKAESNNIPAALNRANDKSKNDEIGFYGSR